MTKFIELCEVCGLHRSRKNKEKENRAAVKTSASEKLPAEDSTDRSSSEAQHELQENDSNRLVICESQ